MLPIDAAARELGVAPVTLRRWARRGCPHQPGQRGRGGAALFDPEAIRAWLATSAEAGSAAGRRALALELSSQLPELMAEAVRAAWCQTDGPDKPRMAGAAALAWYAAALAVAERLRDEDDRVPDPHQPAAIRYLRQIARR